MNNMVVYQGDQYPLRIKLITKRQRMILTPEIVEGVKIRFGEETKTYPNGGLEFDEESKCWIFPLTQAQSINEHFKAKMQCQVKWGHKIRGTEYKMIEVNSQSIKEVW